MSARLRPSGVLSKAADLMASGWLQGTFEYEECFCFRGAISRAAGIDPHDPASPAEMFAARLVLGREPKNESDAGCALVTWNDREGRTQGEVVDLARKASELARSEGQ